MRTYKFNDIVLSVNNNAVQFLNGLTSNTLDAPLNAFLNQHGRIIATFRQKKLNENEVLISVPEIAVDHVLKHLERYAKLSHTKIEPGGQCTYMNIDDGQVIWDAGAHPDSISIDEFTLLRLEKTVPLMGVDYQADEFILNVHEFAYVSYTKGCFLGQEPVAKVHNRSKPTRKLVVEYEECLAQEFAGKMTSKTKDPASGRTKGFVFLDNKSP